MQYSISTSKGTFTVTADNFNAIDGTLYLYSEKKVVAAFREWIGVVERRETVN